MVMDRRKVIEQIEEKSCIAIVRGIEAKHCAALAQALYDGGISLIEVTFDQKDRDGWQQTLEGIRVIRDHLGDKVCVGAGTVMTKEQVTLAKGAGASFLISPHLDTELIRLTNEQGMVAIPGALTPTEVVQAHPTTQNTIFPSATVFWYVHSSNSVRMPKSSSTGTLIIFSPGIPMIFAAHSTL